VITLSARGVELDAPVAIPAATALTICSRNVGSEKGFGVIVDVTGGGLSSDPWPPSVSAGDTSIREVTWSS
jgi:hypothetical protein